MKFCDILVKFLYTKLQLNIPETCCPGPIVPADVVKKVVIQWSWSNKYTKFYYNITKFFGPGPMDGKILLEMLQMVLV